MAVSASGGPKTCIRCGRHMESSETDATASDSVLQAAAPSPSSVAFATEASTSPRMLSRGAEAILLQEEGHHLCASCSINAVQDTGSSAIRTASRDARRRMSVLRHAAQTVDGVGEGEPDVTNTAPVDPLAFAEGSRPGEEGTSASSPSRTRDPSVHPWRRAPWARTPSEGQGLMAGGDAAPSLASSLSISVGGMGAGGDAVLPDNDVDFPPLARSTSAQSPHLPLSPGYGRGTATSPPTTPSHLARQTSFSRSQTSSSIVAGPPSPIVNFPSRGRNRASSTSSSTGGQTVVAVAHNGRRKSATRRLSRSNSSQGPTTTALAEGIAAAIMPLEGEAIEEDPFGPSAMTRPRLSTLTAKQMASSSVSNTVLPDLLYKSSQGDDEGKDEAQRRRHQASLVWFHYHRAEPRLDISKLRCTSRGRGCLFPGAIFNGTQKSGRMSYDVTVQIVNVDLASSHLCGYLNIRGLTDDWPELTTYFDAEIIGQRYGFVTGKWGATEADDMKHWSRFTPFRPLKNSLTKPGLRFNHLNKPFIFMRWKERFLVPDHRVRDINGASFAGFYYVCVELGDEEAVGQGVPSLTTPLSPPLGGATSPTLPATSVPSHPGRRRSASYRRRAGSMVPWADDSRAEASSGAEASVAAMEGVECEGGDGTLPSNAGPMGRMSGFYFHEHSEPYQQLTLQHVPEKSSTTFELR